MKGLSAGWSLQELPCLAAQGMEGGGIWGLTREVEWLDCELAWDLGSPGVR